MHCFQGAGGGGVPRDSGQRIGAAVEAGRKMGAREFRASASVDRCVSGALFVVRGVVAEFAKIRDTVA